MPRNLLGAILPIRHSLCWTDGRYLDMVVGVMALWLLPRKYDVHSVRQHGIGDRDIATIPCGGTWQAETLWREETDLDLPLLRNGHCPTVHAYQNRLVCSSCGYATLSMSARGFDRAICWYAAHGDISEQKKKKKNT